MRMFAVPGLVQGHCDSCGQFAGFDKVGVLDEWVESGKAPDQIIATHYTNGKVSSTRPLCAYPTVAKYKGTGDTDKAENFACVAP
jgi:feruloyl esterase